MFTNVQTDMKFDEFKKVMLGGGVSVEKNETFLKNMAVKPRLKKSFLRLPKSIDWRKYLPSVKDQGQCGSCWAFATVATIEGHCNKHNNDGNVISLSEQELIDCDTTDHGCHGGLPQNGLSYDNLHHGLCTEKDYPYYATENDCRPVLFFFLFAFVLKFKKKKRNINQLFFSKHVFFFFCFVLFVCK